MRAYRFDAPFTVVKRLRQKPAFSHMKIIAVTGYGTEADRRHAVEQASTSIFSSLSIPLFGKACLEGRAEFPSKSGDSHDCSTSHT
jgi:CheY-like chemotaxis protein